MAAVFFYFAFKDQEWEELVAAWSGVNYWYILASMSMGYAAIISRGIRWRLLLEPMGYKPKVWNSIHSVSILYFVNLAVPRAGELARCTSMNQVEEIPVNKLFGTVLLERAIDFIFLIGVLLTSLLLNVDNVKSLFDATASGTSSTDGGTSWFNIVVLSILGLSVLIFILFRRRIQATPFFAKIRDFWEGLKEGFKSITKLKRQRAFWFHSVFIWINYYLMIYICFFSMEATESLSISDGFFIMIAASLGIVIPTPGGIGAYHFLVREAMVVLGISALNGLAFATVVHSAQTLMLFGTGAIASLILYLERRRKRKLA